MPRDFPPAIKQELERYLPSQYEMFWIRGVLFDWHEIQIEVGFGQGPINKLFTSARIADVDSPPDSKVKTYEVVMTGADRQYKFDTNDPISLFCHRLKGSDEVVPRYMVNHNTGMCNIVYKDLMLDERGTFITPASNMRIRKNWMSVKTTSPNQGATLLYGGCLFLFLCFIFFIGGIFLIAVIVSYIEPKAGVTDNSSPFVFTASIAYGVIGLISCFLMAKSAALDKEYKMSHTLDLMPLYKQATDLIYDVIEDFQVPDRHFIIDRREI